MHIFAVCYSDCVYKNRYVTEKQSLSNNAVQSLITGSAQEKTESSLMAKTAWPWDGD